MKFIKRLFVRIFGLKNYFLIISSMFFILYRLRLLQLSRKFDCHYYIRNLIRKGDHVLDIGANFGYYGILFSDLVGEIGQVYAVEPIQLYREILIRNKKSRNNIRIYPYALGEKDGVQIEMGIPGTDISRHGLTHVITGQLANHSKTYTAEMRNPSKLFSGLQRLDYIKCDVEGYEMNIIPLLIPLIEKFRPKLQIETEGDNKKKITALLSSINYSAYHVSKNKLIELSETEISQGDIFYLPNETGGLAV